MLNIFRYILIQRKSIFILFLLLLINLWIYHLFQQSEVKLSRSLPLIVLYTFNRSIKTQENICRGAKNGGHVVNFDHCPKKCQFSCRMEDFQKRSPEAVLFFGEDFYWPLKLTDQQRTSPNQRWIFWSWEAPIHHPEYTKSGLTFNWTMAYRHDSDIVHSYGRYILRNLSSSIRDHQSTDSYLSSTTNQSTYNVTSEYHRRENRILWIVSNCHARSRRNELARDLNTSFPIDQFGQCSSNKITGQFEDVLVKYKFYLAFENAQCEDYITEKLFYNALIHGSIPIVLGAPLNNYQKSLPLNSFIHIEQYQNLSQLATHLQDISERMDLFQSYHQWRQDYRIIAWKSNYLIDDRFCDLCLKLHEDGRRKSYGNFSHWLNRCI